MTFPAHPRHGWLKALRSDRRGSTLVEFAVLAPVMLLLICGGIELGRIALIQSTLEVATSSAARAARVDLQSSEDERDEKLRSAIARQMSPFRTFPGRELTIETMVYRSFGDSYPESFEDLNGNGVWDGPVGDDPGEPFDDRNRNGEFDEAIQQEGQLGGAGDVVAYRAEFPIKLLFGFLASDWGLDDGIVLSSEFALRNEPVAGSSRVSE